MADLPYISSFLSRVEGGCHTRGYIPCYVKTGGSANYIGGAGPERYTAMGASGVTIATGVDLGQKDASELLGYGLSWDILSFFSPYLGKKRGAAIAALHATPLLISKEAAAATDQAVHQGYLKRYVKPTYEKAADVPFDSLPRQAQAVIMSLLYQKGPIGAPKDWPKTWGYLVKQEWKQAAHELMTGFRQYPARRKTEGRLLMEICS